MTMRKSMQWAMANALFALVIGAGAAHATTFYLLDVEQDKSRVTVVEPATFSDPSTRNQS